MMAAVPPATARIHRELPIFRLDDGDAAVLYAPGHGISVTTEMALDVERVLSGAVALHPTATVLASQLVQHGQQAARAWRSLGVRPFAPECLTLYLSNRCNLACSYCYAMPEGDAQARLRVSPSTDSQRVFPILSESTIAAAAELVARNCAASGKPLTLVLHGGGEPTLHWDVLQRTWEAAAAIAGAHGIALWSYIATHGVIAPERALWLASHFNLIGLSCDGPPEIQNANRPTASGAVTATAVRRTAATLADADACVVVRATITPVTVTEQTRIVNYFCDELRAKAIRFEPAYDGRHLPGRRFRPEDAPAFVTHFLAARRLARERGCDLKLSGVFTDEIHGPYCNPLRDVLQLTPNGAASACFLSVGNDPAVDATFELSEAGQATRSFVIDYARASKQRVQATRIPAKCESCHNIYHCARDCPDVCFLDDSAIPETGGFRCVVQKLVGRELILEGAGYQA